MGTRKEYHKRGAEGSRGASTDGAITVRSTGQPGDHPGTQQEGEGISYGTNQHTLRDSKVVNVPKRQKECKEARCDLKVGFMDCSHGRKQGGS